MNKYLSILQPIAELLQKKNTDYGDSYKKLRDEYGAVAFHVRISDKLSRIKQLDSADAQVKEESRRDTLNDIIGYCALEIAYMDGEKRLSMTCKNCVNFSGSEVNNLTKSPCVKNHFYKCYESGMLYFQPRKEGTE